MESKQPKKKKSMKKQLLEKLMEYGDSMLENEKRPRKKLKLKKTENGGRVKSQSLIIEEVSKSTDESSSNTPTALKEKDDLAARFMSNRDKQLLKFKTELGLHNLESSGEKTCKSDLVVKQNTQTDKNGISHKRPPAEIIIFQDHSKRKKENISQRNEALEHSASPYDTEIPGQEFDLKKARLEVQKFGITGFEKAQKDEAMKAFLIKLGAKAPKNKHVNYKEILEKKKKEKEAVKGNQESNTERNSKKSRHNRKRTQDDRVKGFLDGQIGQYKRGVQMVSKEEIKSAKTRKSTRK